MGLISARITSPGRNSTSRYGPVPTGLSIPMASRAPAPLTDSNTWRGSRPPPVNTPCQKGCGLLKCTFTVWESILSIFDDVEIALAGDGGGGGIGGELPVEDHVVGGEGRAVVPLHAALEAPDHPAPVLGDGAGRQRRHLGAEYGDEGAVAPPARPAARRRDGWR